MYLPSQKNATKVYLFFRHPGSLRGCIHLSVEACMYSMDLWKLWKYACVQCCAKEDDTKIDFALSGINLLSPLELPTPWVRFKNKTANGSTRCSWSVVQLSYNSSEKSPFQGETKQDCPAVTPTDIHHPTIPNHPTIHTETFRFIQPCPNPSRGRAPPPRVTWRPVFGSAPQPGGRDRISSDFSCDYKGD